MSVATDFTAFRAYRSCAVSTTVGNVNGTDHTGYTADQVTRLYRNLEDITVSDNATTYDLTSQSTSVSLLSESIVTYLIEDGVGILEPFERTCTTPELSAEQAEDYKNTGFFGDEFDPGAGPWGLFSVERYPPAITDWAVAHVDENDDYHMEEAEIYVAYLYGIYNTNEVPAELPPAKDQDTVYGVYTIFIPDAGTTYTDSSTSDATGTTDIEYLTLTTTIAGVTFQLVEKWELFVGANWTDTEPSKPSQPTITATAYTYLPPI